MDHLDAELARFEAEIAGRPAPTVSYLSSSVDLCCYMYETLLQIPTYDTAVINESNCPHAMLCCCSNWPPCRQHQVQHTLCLTAPKATRPKYHSRCDSQPLLDPAEVLGPGQASLSLQRMASRRPPCHQRRQSGRPWGDRELLHAPYVHFWPAAAAASRVCQRPSCPRSFAAASAEASIHATSAYASAPACFLARALHRPHLTCS